jgi:hypothetical protein
MIVAVYIPIIIAAVREQQRGRAIGYIIGRDARGHGRHRRRRRYDGPHHRDDRRTRGRRPVLDLAGDGVAGFRTGVVVLSAVALAGLLTMLVPPRLWITREWRSLL